MTVKNGVTWVLTEAPRHDRIEQVIDSFGDSKNRTTKLPVYEIIINPNGAGYIEELKITIINDGRKPIGIYAYEVYDTSKST